MVVSICIITYNSEKFIIELLESIKKQTFKNVELVVSDDASTDNTVEVVMGWIENFGSQFISCKVITSKVNTGLVRNLNRGVAVCNGEWIKFIAGDDILEENAIEVFAMYAEKSDSAVIFSYVSHFSKERGVFFNYPGKREKALYTKNRQELFASLLKNGNFLPAPGSFHKMSVLKRLGYFDERIPMMEDFPYWLKCLSMGYSLDCLTIDQPLVKYRVHPSSVSHSSNELNAFRKVVKQEISVIKCYVLPLAKCNIKWHTGFRLKMFAYSLFQFRFLPTFIPRFFLNKAGDLIKDFIPPIEEEVII